MALAALVIWVSGGVMFWHHRRGPKRHDHRPRHRRPTPCIFYASPFIGLFLLKFLAIKWEVVPIPSTPRSPRAASTVAAGGLFLPALTLALLYMAGYVRMTPRLRAGVDDRGPGIPDRAGQGPQASSGAHQHSMRAALTPLVTLIGLDFAGLMGGAIITETVFNYNGLRQDGGRGRTRPTTCPRSSDWCSCSAVRDHRQHHRRRAAYAVIDPRVQVG